MTTSPTYKGSPTLEPSFRYSLVVSLGRHHPTSIPLLLVSLKQTAIHAHFVLHESTTILPSPSTSRTAGKESVQQPMWISHRDKRKSNPTDAGRQTALEPGTVDGEFELYSEKGEKGEMDGQEELFVKFEGEFVVDIWASARGEDRRLVPIRTCQLEITYVSSTRLDFGSTDESRGQIRPDSNDSIRTQFLFVDSAQIDKPSPPSRSARYPSRRLFLNFCRPRCFVEQKPYPREAVSNRPSQI